MTGALVILAAMAVVGLILFLTDRKYYAHHHHSREPQADSVSEGEEAAEAAVKEDDGVCCGLHLVCEKSEMARGVEIIYYDDEELDRFAGKSPESYTSEECEEFRDILLTMLPGDAEGWAHSLKLREIELPPDVKDELMLIVTEQRNSK